jgi:hypothetical protein
MTVIFAAGAAYFFPQQCWAAPGALPWEQTLLTLQDVLVSCKTGSKQRD